jgi:PHD/YefM family antitoxin component YafN of YafNO toxin-antitoxin module
MKQIKTIDYLAAQSTLAKTMRQVCETDLPIAIDGAGKDQVVMMSLKTYNEFNAKCPAKPFKTDRK